MHIGCFYNNCQYNCMNQLTEHVVFFCSETTRRPDCEQLCRGSSTKTGKEVSHFKCIHESHRRRSAESNIHYIVKLRSYWSCDFGERVKYSCFQCCIYKQSRLHLYIKEASLLLDLQTLCVYISSLMDTAQSFAYLSQRAFPEELGFTLKRTFNSCQRPSITCHTYMCTVHALDECSSLCQGQTQLPHNAPWLKQKKG